MVQILIFTPVPRGSYVEEEMLTLPWADHLEEFLVFGAFHDGVNTGEFRPKDLMQRLGFLEHIERVTHDVGNVRLAG